MSADETALAWAYLARVAEPPCAALISLVDDLGPVDAAAAVRRRVVPDRHADVLTATEARYGDERAAADLDAADRIGARLLTPADEGWPGWALMALGQADSAARGGEPLALWVRGPGAADAAGIALVGSRAASSYGEHVAATIASGLVDAGWAVYSGGAYGIDGAAHRAALGTAGHTTAVLACGIDRDYPAGHAALLDQIAQRGLIVSEYPPGTTAAKHRFLTRNRLVAALSSAVIVVEAGRRSGAANTAAWARKLGRPLGAVPGPVTSAMSVGCHRMIGDGLATLVTDAPSAISLAAPNGGGDIGRGPERQIDRLTDTQRRVHDALPARGDLSIDDVVLSSGLEIGAVRSALAHLEIAGLAAVREGRWCLSR